MQDKEKAGLLRLEKAAKRKVFAIENKANKRNEKNAAEIIQSNQHFNAYNLNNSNQKSFESTEFFFSQNFKDKMKQFSRRQQILQDEGAAFTF